MEQGPKAVQDQSRCSREEIRKKIGHTPVASGFSLLCGLNGKAQAFAPHS